MCMRHSASQQQDLSAPIRHVPEMNAVSLLCDDRAVANQQHPCNFSSPTATAASYRTIRGVDYHHHRVTIPGGEVVSITKNIIILTPSSSTAVDEQPLSRPKASICSQRNICSDNPSSYNNAYDTQQSSRISRTNSMASAATIADGKRNSKNVFFICLLTKIINGSHKPTRYI